MQTRLRRKQPKTTHHGSTSRSFVLSLDARSAQRKDECVLKWVADAFVGFTATVKPGFYQKKEKYPFYEKRAV